jgi:hypothetical protein
VPYLYLYFYTSYKKFRMEKKHRPPYTPRVCQQQIIPAVRSPCAPPICSSPVWVWCPHQHPLCIPFFYPKPRSYFLPLVASEPTSTPYQARRRRAAQQTPPQLCAHLSRKSDVFSSLNNTNVLVSEFEKRKMDVVIWISGVLIVAAVSKLHVPLIYFSFWVHYCTDLIPATF